MRIFSRVPDWWEVRFESISNEAMACLSGLHHLLCSKATELLTAGRNDEAANIYRCLYRDAALSPWAAHGLKELSQETEVEQAIDFQDLAEDMVDLLCKQHEMFGDYAAALRLCEHAYFRKPESHHPADSSSKDCESAGRLQERLANYYHGFILRVRKIHPEWELVAGISTLYSFARALKRSAQVWNGILPVDWRSNLLNCTEGRHLADSMPALAMYAVAYYDLPDLLHALFPGQWLNQVSLRDQWCRTALHMASELGSYEVARFLIDEGADTDETDAGDDTPLHLACLQKKMDIITLLIDAGANVNARNADNDTPLHSLLTSPSEGKTKSLMKPIVRHLLEANANPEFLNDTNQNALHYAAQYGGLEVVKLLTPNLFHLGKLQDQDKARGYTPLHCAINSGAAKVALHLIEQGHNVNIPDYEGGTPLHLACYHLGGFHASEVIECLLGHGALIDKLDSLYNTPLHCAAQWGKEDAVKTLLERGAPINPRNNEGQTPFMLAYSQGRTRVWRILSECARNRGEVLY